ncbi:hypothetical protein SAMN05192560_0903 [Methylobacillus rhizosphaerae]|uniref:Uncharacterized protein n=2 Tax=Methylobacillus rhizosphaerae TaxID=551994 RepID=A0A238YWW8_9PROT|nr:hypothetical protein SAMN05192560_0903 [Methylobacillus rhizosphaerae]
MVLVAATVLTVFSVLGSAVVTSLTPARHDLAQMPLTDPNAASVISNTLNSQGSTTIACTECGTIISINEIDDNTNDVSNAERKLLSTTYIIKVKMRNGSLQTVTQYNTPRHAVGDAVRLQSGRLVNA